MRVDADHSREAGLHNAMRGVLAGNEHGKRAQRIPCSASFGHREADSDRVW